MNKFRQFNVLARRSLLFCILVCLPFCAGAVSRLHSLDITVLLDDNGDAYITEVRRATVDNQGTEWFNSIGNIDDNTRICQLNVSDETGMTYQNIGTWEVNHNREWKKNKCGIVQKEDGCELCWGLGLAGERTYTTSYVVTNMARAFNDYDGLFFMFVQYHLNPSPERVTLTIGRKDGKPLPKEATETWVYEFDGDYHWSNGKVVVRAEDGIKSNEAMIILLRLDKGILHPAIKEHEDFVTP